MLMVDIDGELYLLMVEEDVYLVCTYFFEKNFFDKKNELPPPHTTTPTAGRNKHH